MEKSKFNVLSPDGFQIDLEEYENKEKAWKAFEMWKNRFEMQGYYSSNKGRISLNELKNHCKLIKY